MTRQSLGFFCIFFTFYIQRFSFKLFGFTEILNDDIRNVNGQKCVQFILAMYFSDWLVEMQKLYNERLQQVLYKD